MWLGAALSIKGSKSVPGPFSVNPGRRDSWGGGGEKHGGVGRRKKIHESPKEEGGADLLLVSTVLGH